MTITLFNLKKQAFTTLIILFSLNLSIAQVGIGTETPHDSSQLELKSTTKGFLPPRMTEDERNNISSPAQGLVIYCSNCGTNGEAQVYNGTEWTNMTGGAVAEFVCGTSTVTFTYNGESVTYGTVLREYGGDVGSKCWLDRNLGASQVASSSTDTDAYGDYFQWGRGDDGHQIRTSDTRIELSSNDQPGHGDFILSPNADDDYDWLVSKNDNLWEGINGLNNPCPSGFRVPTDAEWQAELDASNGITNAKSAFKILKLPLPGYRSWDIGSLFDVGTDGYYWSSSVSSTNSHYLRLISGNAGIGIDGRAIGFSVRCLKD